jgi:hypothetical protein
MVPQRPGQNKHTGRSDKGTPHFHQYRGKFKGGGTRYEQNRQGGHDWLMAFLDRGLQTIPIGEHCGDYEGHRRVNQAKIHEEAEWTARALFLPV